MEFSSSLVIQDVCDNDPMEKTYEADFETAIHFAKNGRFQKLLLAVCGTIYATCAISMTTLSFVLPSAECDFNLTSMDKGKLTATPLIGMIVGCTVWGAIADSRGRKLALILSLLVDFFASISSSAAQSFQLFLVCRFFNGFGIIGATNIIFSYLGEFLSVNQRDVMLGRLEIFWNFGIVILPVLAWSLLSTPVHHSFCYHAKFSPWRIFVLICGIPSLLSSLMLCFLPETPKFLMSKEKFEDAKAVFQQMYVWNTRKPSRFYPVMSLEGELENNNVLKFPEKSSLVLRLGDWCNIVLDSIKVLFSQPFLKYLLITSFADFGLMMSYYTLIMWFPEIFSRFYEFEVQNPNVTAGILQVFQNNATRNNIFFNFHPCDPSIDFRVFLDTLIIGLSCIPTSVSLSYFMKKVGKITVLVVCLIASGLATLALIGVRSTVQTLVLSCIFEALTSILEAVLFCVVVDLFPTNLRAIALAMTAMSGRLGAILGNIIFGILLDINCLIPIYLFGFLLIASGFLCLAIPRTENYIVLQ